MSDITQDLSVRADFLVLSNTQNNSVAINFAPYVLNQSVITSFTRPNFGKTYTYKVFDGSTFVKIWSTEVLSEPAFRSVINGGPGELTIRLARKFDDFGEDVDVKLLNKVEVWCFDRDEPNGLLLYSGFISGYRPVLDGHSEYVEITLLPYLVEMSNIMFRNSAGETKLNYLSQDPSTIFTDIIDKYRADGGTINYGVDTIDTTGTTVSYEFNCYNIKEALDKLIELTPENWYWRVDADNVAHLHLSDMETAAHQFLIGKHINYMETWRRAEDLVNRVYFIGQEYTTASGTQVPYYWSFANNGSISSYGIHALKQVDQRVATLATAQIMANNVINTKKDPEIRTTLTIVDNNGQNANLGYDIESIKPGQTFRIRNIKQGVKTVSLWDVAQWDIDVWDQTLAYAAASVIQILSVEYVPNMVRIEASSRLPEIQKRIEDIQRNIEDTQTWNAPTEATAV